MNDKIIQIEVALNFLNTLFAKAIYFSDKKMIKEIELLRRNIYYGDFEYDSFLKKLQEVEKKLNQYE